MSEAEEELKLKLIMIEHSRDDPVLELKLIDLLYQAYAKHSIKVPNGVDKFLKMEKERITPLIYNEIRRKKAEVKVLIEKKREQALKEHEKEEQEQQKEKEKKLTRTQLIFGE